MFVCDLTSHAIKKIDLTTGIILISFYLLFTTNTGNMRSIGSGKQGFKDGIAEVAQFSSPSGITQSELDGSLLVCDSGNHKIRKITFEGILHSLQLYT